MKIEEVIKQLESILDHVCSMAASPDADDIWRKDIDALKFALTALRSMPEAGEPLSLEQLREMKGKPVWIVEYPDWGHWELSEDAEDYLCDRDTELYGLTYPDPDGKAGLHKLGWLAYSYPPVHIDRSKWEPCGACKNGEITIHVPEFRAMAVCNQHMDREAFDLTLRLKFCSWCGRPLTEEAWAELEKRLGVRT